MLTTFVTTLKVLTRDRNVLLWSLAFPLVLSTLFYAMFSNLDELYKLDPIPLVVVEDDFFAEAEIFGELLDTLSVADQDGEDPLFSLTYVPNEDAALDTLLDGEYAGYIQVDSDGSPVYHKDGRYSNGAADPSQSIIMSVLDRYVQNTELITSLVKENPSLLADPEFWDKVSEDSDEQLTQQVSVTANPPSDSLRYFYAVLAFSTIMMATIALVAVDMVLGNTSPLGARRSLGGQSKIKTLVPTLSAAWLLSFACVMLGFVYLRFVFNIDFGGKDAAVVLVLAVGTLAITFLGSLLGSIPLSGNIKGGFVAFLSCFLSLFAGLYGPFSQDLGDMVARDLPWLSAANPVRQVADAFFSLYYYDDFAQLTACLTSLLVFCGVFFVLSVLFLRRQRYASL